MIFRAFFDWVISILPNMEMPSEILQHVQNVVSWAYFANHYLPITTFFECLAVYFAVWMVCMIVSVIIKIF